LDEPSAPSSEPSVAPAPPPPAPSRTEPQPQAQAPQASDGKSIFDNVRGHAYNPYATAAAATTVFDLILTPSDISGQKFFYVSPSDKLGYAAFEMLGGSFLLGLDNSPVLDVPCDNCDGNTAALILGYANSAFGVALNYSVSKEWTHRSDNSDLRVTYPGDNLQVFFSLPIGGPTIYANAGWLTYSTGYAYTGNSVEYSVDYSSLTANAGLIGAAGSLNYDVFLGAERYGGTLTDNDGNKLIDNDTYLGFELGARLGLTTIQKQNARVIAGVNASFIMMLLDEVSPPSPAPKVKSDNKMAGVISPNILGEVAMFDNLLAFTGATHNLIVKSGDADRNKKTSYLGIASVDNDIRASMLSRTLNMAGTDAFVGVRYQKPDWALEAQVSANPFEAINGGNVFTSFGGFIYF
jgi:hypothetical protein